MDDVTHPRLPRRRLCHVRKIPSCDLTPLAPSGYREAFYLELSYSEGYGEIAYDYLKGDQEAGVNAAYRPTTSDKHA